MDGWMAILVCSNVLLITQRQMFSRFLVSFRRLCRDVALACNLVYRLRRLDGASDQLLE